MECKYYYRSRFSEAKFRQLLKLFTDDLNATQIASLTGVSRISVNKMLNCFRSEIFNIAENHYSNLSIKPMLIINNHNGQEAKFIQSAFAKIYNKGELRRKIKFPELEENEEFWKFSKARLQKFKGVNKSNLFLHLKESEFRYNTRTENIYKLMLTHFEKNPINSHKIKKA